MVNLSDLMMQSKRPRDYAADIADNYRPGEWAATVVRLVPEPWREITRAHLRAIYQQRRHAARTRKASDAMIARLNGGQKKGAD